MSQTFHSKYHRVNHMTYKDLDIPDAGWDPIASQECPFRGNFYIFSGTGPKHGSLYSKEVYTVDLFPWTGSKINVNTNLYVTKDITGRDNLYIKNNITGGGYLEISNYGTFGSYVHISGSDASGYGLVVNEDSHFIGSADIDTNLNVDGYTYINGSDASGYGLVVENDLRVKGESLFDGKITANGGMDVSGDVSITGDFTLLGDSHITGDTDQSGNVTLTGDCVINGNCYVTETATANNGIFRDVYISHHLSAVSATFHNIDITASEASGFIITGERPPPEDYYKIPTTPVIEGKNNLYLDKAGLFVDGWTILSGDVSMNRDLNVKGTTTLNTLIVTGTATVQKDTTLEGKLNVSGSTVIDNSLKTNSLNVTGNASVGGAFNVAGNTTMTTFTATQDGTIEGTGTIGTLYITGDSTFDGDATFNGNVDIPSGDTTIAMLYAPEINAGTIDASGDVTVDGNFSVISGEAQVTTLYVGTMDSSGDVTIAGNVSIISGGDLDVNGSVGIDENLAVSGSVDIGDYLTVGTRKDGSTTGKYSVSIGSDNVASTTGSYAQGQGASATGKYSTAVGHNVSASGEYSHAEGAVTSALGGASHAEGGYTFTSADYSHAEGVYNFVNYEYDSGTSAIVPSSTSLHTVGFGKLTTYGVVRQNAVETMFDGKTYVYGVGGYDGTNATGAGVEDLATVINDMGMKEVSYDSLVDLKNNNKLVPGRWYRITDYEATTTQPDTQPAGVRYDIIVRADSSNVLNENAYAAKNANDSYFTEAGSNLESWRLKYSLLNDTNRFAWADTTGKGVVYWLQDEFGNECPYDFKGIKFKRWAITDITSTKLEGNSLSLLKSAFVYNSNTNPIHCSNFSSDSILANGTTFLVDSNESRFYFTFDVDGNDSSLIASNDVYMNKIEPYISQNKIKLNSNVFLGVSAHGNTFGNNCYENTFASGCRNNTFANGCTWNMLGPDCYWNTFDDGCYTNVLGSSGNRNTFGIASHVNTLSDGCTYNTFGPNFHFNTFSSGCRTNRFDTSCYSNNLGLNCVANTFGVSSYNNTFGTLCSANEFGDLCYNNNFGSSCRYNTFESNCYNNTFGNSCTYNVFGNSCYYNIFGSNCYNNMFENKCYYNVFGSNRSSPLGYYQYIRFESGVNSVCLYCNNTLNADHRYEYVTVSQGIKGTSSNMKLITDQNINQTFKTTYQPADSRFVSVSV